MKFSEKEEFIAEINNKLTPAKTALDLLSKGKDMPKEFIEMALNLKEHKLMLLEDIIKINLFNIF